MGQVDNVRRLIKEEFKKEDQETVGKIGFVINRFMDQVVNIINGNIDFDNLNNFDTMSFSMTVDSSGIPIGNNLVKATDILGTSGLIVVNAKNKTDNTLFPSATPFISTTTNSNSQVIKIDHISGVQADNEYEYVVIAIG